jgi:hypothetical protein
MVYTITMQKFLLLLALVIGIAGCDPRTEDLPQPAQQAYIPVYYKSENIAVTKFTSARAMQRAGKQYVIGGLLLQNEINEGIHIIDVTNPSSPKKLGFLEIPLCTEIAVKQGFLYTNNYDDLLVFDLRGPGEPKLLKRIENVFPPANQDYPPFFNVLFECPDPAKGVVVDWELKSNVTTKCRR